MSEEGLEAAAERWRDDGWVLIESLVPADVIAAARAEIPRVEAAPTSATNPSRRTYEPDGGRAEAFRLDQFSGTVLFPLHDAPNLNRLFVDRRVVDFAQRALQTTDIRIYQSRVWSKYSGRVNYSQPHHRDLNHSLVPTRSEPGWWHLECFLYLTDVDDETGAPRLVPRSDLDAEPASHRPQTREDAPGLYEVERSAPGPAGSLLAYRSDVWHRGVDLVRPGSERHVVVVAFKPAGLDWIGYDAHPPLSINADFGRFVAASTPRDLALFGVPLPGHPYWTAATVDAMAAQYPGLDTEPWRSALGATP